MMSNGWIYVIDEHGQTPLNRAIRSDHMALTELLLRQDAEDRLSSLEGSSVLHKAAFLGLHEAVKVLLDEGADPNAQDKYGETPLHKAARQGHWGIVGMLIDHGADVNATSELGLSALHWVAMNGQLSLADLLLNAGADPNLSDDYLDDLSPLMLARVMGYDDLVNVLDRHPHVA